MIEPKVRNTKERNRIVAHAKAMLKEREALKWKIVEAALSVCYFNDKKGNMPKGAYSITNFAEDIGLNRKTLSDWILDYKSVYIRIKDDLPKDMDFSTTKRVLTSIDKTRRELYNFNASSMSQAIEAVPKKIVLDTFNKHLEKDALSRRLENLIKYSNHAIYTFSNEVFEKKHTKLIEDYYDNIKVIEKLLKRIVKNEG